MGRNTAQWSILPVEPPKRRYGAAMALAGILATPPPTRELQTAKERRRKLAVDGWEIFV